MRLVVLYLSGNEQIKAPLFGTTQRVKRDSRGLPKILPVQVRSILERCDFIKDRNVLIAILSLVSVFRVMGFKVTESLKTIVSQFSGITKSYDPAILGSAIFNLFGPGRKLTFGPVKAVILESAGPNGFKSTWAASLDAIAYLFYPKEYESLIKLFIIQPRGFRYVLWMLLIQVVALPLIIILIIIGWHPNLNLGKLSVVRDQAGKARVVAITNWWLQVALKPTHLALFSILRDVEQDGTFDQEACLNLLVNKRWPGLSREAFELHMKLGTSEQTLDSIYGYDNQTFYSFDLSSATDRLPVDLQETILNTIRPGFGTLWKDALSIPWTWTDGREIRYSVGQPMGAYSSWAMLALTHHVIVQLAALRAGYNHFSHYAVLGDDIVIADKQVAEEYLLIMHELGVSINLNKSVISNRFAEFAKRLRGPNGIDITPIGPGLTLRLVRDDAYVPVYVTNALKCGLISTFDEVLCLLSLFPDYKYSKKFWVTLWSVLSMHKGNMNLSPENAALFNAGTSWIFLSSPMGTRVTLYKCAVALLRKSYHENRAGTLVNTKFFAKNWFRLVTSRNPATVVLELLLKIISPGFWVYGFEFLAALLDQFWFSEIPHIPFFEDVSDFWKTMAIFGAKFIPDIDWTKRAEIKLESKVCEEMLSIFNKHYIERYNSTLFKAFSPLLIDHKSHKLFTLVDDLELSNSIQDIEDSEVINHDSVPIDLLP